MGRKRSNPADAWLPPRVYRGKSAYEFRPAGGKCTKLAPLVRDESGAIIEPPEVMKAVLAEYEKASIAARSPKNVSYWLSQFMASEKFQRLGKHTQEDYRRYIEVVVDPSSASSKATHNGIRHVFGNMNPAAVKPTHIRKYMDYWASPRSVTKSNGDVIESPGKTTTANRHLTCLQTFFKWLRQYLPGIESNPAEGIIRFPEKQRKVLITDDQYMALLDAALVGSRPYMFAFIEIAYLCGLRLHEVTALNLEDIDPEGEAGYLRVRRGKGSRGELIEISDRLRKAIHAAISMHPVGKVEPLTGRPLVRNTRGERVSRSAAHNAWLQLRKETGLSGINIHDLKKKAGSDGKDLGHRTARMRELYDLSLQKGKATR